jgi:hypothetical protein
VAEGAWEQGAAVIIWSQEGENSMRLDKTAQQNAS